MCPGLPKCRGAMGDQSLSEGRQDPGADRGGRFSVLPVPGGAAADRGGGGDTGSPATALSPVGAAGGGAAQPAPSLPLGHSPGPPAVRSSATGPGNPAGK
ncbi:collagen alpha-1(I) chain-like [Pristis pectinata]|uniref:collagen alpha-1(I) chain-like n=1 Tax=Pristis pectinata TaxID=685728 RepID=UPI00223CC8FC|nr:collagen alpha-1(I) chain-like [Pristis pectinata]